MPIDTLIVILNYRTPDLTIQCLRSLCCEVTPSHHRVVVVDGGSGDGAAGEIDVALKTEGWSDWASLMVLPDNRGYAAGNNAVIRTALAGAEPPRYVLILNPDTMVREGAIRALVEFMDNHPAVGVAGSRLESPDGTQQCAAFRFPSILGELGGGLRLGAAGRFLAKWSVALPLCKEPCRADWVAGASFMVRRQVFEELGLMDERFFLYYEEVDFCLRARQTGWECWHVPQSRVVHLIGKSTGVSSLDQPPARRPAYWFESRQRYFQKSHGRFYAAMADLAWMIGFSLWRVRRAVQRRPDNDPPRLLWDFLRHSALIRPARL